MTTINYVYLTSAFSVESVKSGLTTESLGTIVVQMDSLQYFANNQIIKMIKSLNDESSVSVKDSKEVLVKALFDELNQLEVEEVKVVASRASNGGARKSSGPSTKDTCYLVFKDYNLMDKEDSKLALVDAMKACGMEADDIKAKRVIQSYMSYYRNDVKSGKVTEGKSVTGEKPDTEVKPEIEEQETE
ncbi:hypothetical protein birk_11 [Salmonella phage birk]|uniref:Uncharacterized protein n=1 Tax=Salmonella phage birk TaxID=2713282 RepID=A0A6G8RAZ4_9CAUD|nr:hypothetical protein HWD20_gp11 [Salmonella phage birk]QIN98585.1 hypothetical protein birk_11 [Salmonella phage birk]